jgi:hypothetical protein
MMGIMASSSAPAVPPPAPSGQQPVAGFNMSGPGIGVEEMAKIYAPIDQPGADPKGAYRALRSQSPQPKSLLG